MKKIILIFVMVFIFITPVYAAQQTNNDIEVPTQWQEIFDDAPFNIEDLKGLNFPQIILKLSDIFGDNIQKPIKLFSKIIILLLFASIARGFFPSGLNQATNNVLDTIVTLAVFTLCATPVLNLINDMISTIDTTKTYLSGFVPVFASVLVSCGQIGSAAVYSGFFFSTVMLIANFLCSFGLPAIRMLFALSIVDGVCNVFDFSKLSAMFMKLAKWALMIGSTVFIVIIGLQTTFADAADTLAIKTGKLLFSAGIPVIGRAISDAMSSVYTGLKMIKGTAGIALVGVIAVSYIPLFAQAILYYVILNVSSAIAGATGNKSCGKMFTGIGDGITLSMLFLLFFCTMAVLATIFMVFTGGSI